MTESSFEPPELVLTRNRFTLLVPAIASFLFAAVPLVAIPIVYFQNPDDRFGPIFATAMLFPMIPAGILLFRMYWRAYRDPNPVLILDRMGIYSGDRRVFLAWSSIREIDLSLSHKYGPILHFVSGYPSQDRKTVKLLNRALPPGNPGFRKNVSHLLHYLEQEPVKIIEYCLEVSGKPLGDKGKAILEDRKSWYKTGSNR